MASSPKFSRVDDSRVDDSTLKNCDEDSDLHDVMEAVLPLCAQWYELGLALRINPNSLDTIKETESDPKKRLIALMKTWLSKGYNFKKFGNPSWKLLCAAVHSPVGGNNPALAEKIAEKHLTVAAVTRASGSSTTTTSSTPGPSGSSTTTSGFSQNEVEHDALDSEVELRLIYNLPISDLDGVGLELGISPNTLRDIQKNNRGDEASRKREILGEWLRQDIKASYKKLAEVLHSHEPPEADSIVKLAKNLGCSVDVLIPPDQPVSASPPTVSIGYGHLLDQEDSSDLATMRSAASQWRDIDRHLGFKDKELNDMISKSNTRVDYLEQWLNCASPLRSYAYTEDLVEAPRAAKLEKPTHTSENNERFMIKENYKQIERATHSTGSSSSVPELEVLMSAVAAKIPYKWRLVGIQLGIPVEALDDIQLQVAWRPNSSIDAFELVLGKWKSLHPHKYTWSTIINALEAPSVDAKVVAAELRTIYFC